MPEERSVKVRLKGDISDFNRALLEASTGTKAFVRDLDSSTDRMSNLTQSALALVPALIPIGAAAVPAIAGLTNQLAFAGAAAGVAVLAFQGVGTALDAVNKYSIEPTTANFTKMNEALATLGPEGQDFVMFLQKLRPELQQLQEAGQAGLFPGLESGIKSMMDLLPQAEKIVSTVAKSIGDLIAEAGDNLNDPRWRQFFEFIDREARPTLMDMGHTVGNFAESFANLWMAFSPLSTNFSHSFLDLSRDFSKWTDGLDKTQGFQEFVDYINRVGPKAWDTLGAVANALLQIVEAAAPVGEATLPAITALSNIIATLADSNLGPVVIGIISLTSAVSRLKAVATAGNSSALGNLFGKSGYGGLGATLKSATTATTELKIAQDKLAASSIAARDAQFALIPAAEKRQALAAYSADLRSVAGAEKAVTFATQARRTQMLKLGAGAAGLGLVVSGLDEKMGLTNTASLALAGSLVGPWGAAIGGGIGLALDFAAATDSVGDSFKRVSQSLQLGSAGYDQQAKDLAKAKKAMDDYAHARKQIGADDGAIIQGPAGAFADAKNQIEGIFGKSDVEEQADKFKKLAAAVRQSGIEKDQERAAELGLTVDLKGTTNSLRDQTLAVLTNIDAHNKRVSANSTALGAEIAYQAAIDATTDSIKKNGKTHDLDTEKGRANVATLKAQADAWSGLAPSAQLADGALEGARKRFITSAEAMGYNAKQARQMATDLLNIPPDVVTAVKLLGADASAAKIAEVIDGYNLTPEEIDTALKATDLTKPQIKAVNKALDALDAKRANPKIGVKDEATSKINQIQRLINGMNGKTVRVAVAGGTGGGITMQADGGYIRGPGGPRDDMIPAMLSNGEYVVNAAATARNLSTLHAMNAQKFASGGPVLAPMPRPQSMASQFADAGFDYDRFAAAMAQQPFVLEAALSVGGRQFALAVQDALTTIARNK